MASTEEKGHAKNLANGRKLLVAINQQQNYNPSNPNLAPSNLENFLSNCEGILSKSIKAVAPYRLAVDNRENLFDPLSKKITKIFKAFKASEGVDEKLVEDFMTISRLLKGTRKSNPKLEDNPEEASATHSTSQMGFDKRTSNMDLLISLLDKTSGYSPNEPEYQVSTIQALRDEMFQSTQKVSDTFFTLNNLKSTRNNEMYLKKDNLIDVFTAAKNYLLSILNSSSAQYKTISKIQFKKII